MPPYDYDLITLGAGSGGVRASRLAGGYGARVAVIEKSRIGGTCVIRGCVPKKLLVYAAHFAHDFEDAAGFGWRIERPKFDWPTLIAAKDRELERLEGVYRQILHNNKVTLIEGTGALADRHTVQVNGKTITGEKILLATGGQPALPNIPGIEHAITSNEALDLPQIPRRIAIVGGGYIAVEFAGIFNALGVEVTIIIRANTLLRGFDEDICTTLASEMEKNGIRIRRECLVSAIVKTNDRLSLQLSTGESLDADTVLYATGRVPNTQGLGLEAAGVVLNKQGAVAVNASSQTAVDNIFAVGDCTDRINLTPVAIAEGRAFSETHFNNNPIRMDYENIASAVFSMPPVGSVGLTAAEARARGPVDIFRTRFKSMKHTLSGRDERTMMKLVVDRESNRVLGCHMVGADAPEIVQGLAVAMKCGATKRQFDATVGIHPTAAEEFVTMREPEAD